MQADRQGATTHSWHLEVFQNLTNIQEYQWLQSDPNWLQDTTYTVNDGELFVYCADGVPYPQPPLFSAECRLNASVGWTYAVSNIETQ